MTTTIDETARAGTQYLFDLELSEQGISDTFRTLYALPNESSATNGLEVAKWRNGRYYAFNADAGKWYEWDMLNGWNTAQGLYADVANIVAWMCENEADKLELDKGNGTDGSDDGERKRKTETRKLKARWRKLAVYNNALKIAAATMTVHGWNRYGSVLGTIDGMCADLSEDMVYPSMLFDFTTKRTGIEPAAPTGLWLRFINEFCGYDVDLVNGLQLWAGASLFKGNDTHKAHILFGDGGTGKGVFLLTIQKALGQYAASAQPSIFTEAHQSQHPAALLPFIDHNIVVLPEMKGGTFKSDILKTVVACDAISVRGMRENPRTETPSATLWFSANEMPVTRTIDNALKRRLLVWPFNNKPQREDTGLVNALHEDDHLAGVLGWLMIGAKQYAKLADTGQMPTIPDAVKRATEEYFNDVDWVGRWITDNCDETGATTAKMLYADFRKWSAEQGVTPLSRKQWGGSMSKRYERVHRGTGDVYNLNIRAMLNIPQ